MSRLSSIRNNRKLSLLGLNQALPPSLTDPGGRQLTHIYKSYDHDEVKRLNLTRVTSDL